jgi:hypothetical protein
MTGSIAARIATPYSGRVTPPLSPLPPSTEPITAAATHFEGSAEIFHCW